MQHAFAMTRDYAIIFDPPCYMEMDFLKIVFANGMLKDMINNDAIGTTKVHVVRLSDGQVTTIDAKKWLLIFHFGNSYQIDDNTIVVEGPAYDNPFIDPFSTFAYGNIKSADALLKNGQGNVFMRFVINLNDNTISIEELIHSERGAFDLP